MGDGANRCDYPGESWDLIAFGRLREEDAILTVAGMTWMKPYSFGKVTPCWPIYLPALSA